MDRFENRYKKTQFEKLWKELLYRDLIVEFLPIKIQYLWYLRPLADFVSDEKSKNLNPLGKSL